MSTRTSRNSKRTVAALAAFGVIASTFAIGSPVSADLYDVVSEGDGPGGIRLVPETSEDNQGNQDQPAPVVQAGVDGQPAASSQVLFHNEWLSGDRILVQLFDSAQLNCESRPQSIGYGALPTVTVSGAFAFDPANNSPWGPNDGLPGLPEVPIGGNQFDGFIYTEDEPVAVAALTAPTFNVEFEQSTGCSANNINDILVLEFNNASTMPSSDVAWVVTIDGVTLNIGAAVTAGPVNQVPFGQNATEAAPGYENTVALFSGNQAALQSDAVLEIFEWTNPAFVAPITLTSDNGGALVADSFAQDLGSVTLSETQGVVFSVGTYRLCFGPGISDINEDLLTVTTSSAGVVVPAATVDVYSSAVSFNDCIEFDITAATAGLDSITIGGIFGNVDTAGTKTVSLVDVPPAFETSFLTPDDQTPGAQPLPPLQTTGVGPFTDVNLGVLDTFVAPLGSATNLVDRIGGNDRFETAAKIAYSAVSVDDDSGDCADYVVLVNGNSFPDSLTASYLAGALTLSSNNEDGTVPILTTSGTSLHPAAELAIRELGVRTVYIIGGTNAVSADVAAAVDALPRTLCGGTISDNTQTVQVDRIAGADRYATNRTVVQRAQSILDGDTVDYNDRIRYQANAGEASQRTALMASGENFADAMSAGPISFGFTSREFFEEDGRDYGFPLVLTTPTTLSPDAALTLTNLDIDQVVVVGGEAAVSAGVVASLEALGIDVIRLAGADRYETNVRVRLWASTPEFPNEFEAPSPLAGGAGYNLGLGWSLLGDVVLARGDDFADALAVAPYVASLQGLLVLTTPTTLHPVAGAFISGVRDYRDGFSEEIGFDIGGSNVVAIGLGAAITGNVLDEANALANP